MPNCSRRQAIPLMLAAVAMPAVAVAQPGQYRAQDCARAVRRGMQYLERVGSSSDNFSEFGADAIWSFVDLSRTADPEVSKRARVIGQRLAHRWHKENPRVPERAGARAIGRLLFGSFASDRIGVASPRLKEEIERAAKRFGPLDVLKFDPAREPVPDDMSDRCENCGTQNARGVLTCVKCTAPVKLTNPYDTLGIAMIELYVWERYGLSFGTTLADLVQHLPKMRPYRGYENGRNAAFDAISLAVTHVVYVFNDYYAYRLKPEWLPAEYEFLRANLKANLATTNADLMGEYLDSLKSFGVTDDDPLLRTGIDFLLRQQNEDGSWGSIDRSGDYTLFHATSTAVNGLSHFAYQGEQTAFPDALRRAYDR